MPKKRGQDRVYLIAIRKRDLRKILRKQPTEKAIKVLLTEYRCTLSG